LRIRLSAEGQERFVFCFVHRRDNQVWVWVEDHAGHLVSLPELNVVYYPYRNTGVGIPDPDFWPVTTENSALPSTAFGVEQWLPSRPPSANPPQPPTEPAAGDHRFALLGKLAGAWKGARTERSVLLAPSSEAQPAFRLAIVVLSSAQGAASRSEAEAHLAANWREAPWDIHKGSETLSDKFWSASSLELSDTELESAWYRNQYWLSCCLAPGKVAPGLFGNWLSGWYDIGTAWHSDYHFDYNAQQAYWGVFSSNHVEQHEPYVKLCWDLLPISQIFAQDHFGLPGAHYPVSAYPVPRQVYAYPALPWTYLMCLTAWALQSLWWQYLYTQDAHYLKGQAYPLLREGARFYCAFLKMEPDGRYHVFPTVVPEMHGFTVDFRYNKDCIIDLALIRFLLDAVIQASELLHTDAEERTRWREVYDNLAEYPVGQDAKGKVWLDVPQGTTESVYNIPVTLAPVFPGEQVGLHSEPSQLELARRTAKLVRLEGGNDFVYFPMILARLGILDLEIFKREIHYCLLPNGTCTDRVRQTGGRYGRYKDSTNFDHMVRMGIWIENLALPAVINECLLQSYTGILRLFPNVNGLERARFESLRAAGGFLVTAEWKDNGVGPILIKSLAGRTCRVHNPWPAQEVAIIDLTTPQEVERKQRQSLVEFSTQVGHTYRLQRS
jgi:hypothetical protein